MAQRKSLRERNLAAYRPAEVAEVEPAAAPKKQAPREQPAPVSAAPAAPAAPAAARARRTRPAAQDGAPSAVRADGTVTLKAGLNVPRVVLADSRRAYVADLDDLEDPPGTHAEWIERAMLAHAALELAERQRVAAELPALEGDTTKTPRSYYFDPQAVDRITDTLAAERRSGQVWRSQAEFGVEAMRVAIEASRARRGGVLPTAPSRLPNRARRARRA